MAEQTAAGEPNSPSPAAPAAPTAVPGPAELVEGQARDFLPNVPDSARVVPSLTSPGGGGRQGQGAADDDTWQLPPGQVDAVRDRDFVRLTALQASLKASCKALRHFVGREFKALAQAFPDFAEACLDLKPENLAESIGKFSARLEAMATRIEKQEKLRIAFIGPLKAGKSTLINILLTAHLGRCEDILPVANIAATNCIWKVESTATSVAEVLVEGKVLRSWDVTGPDPKEAANIRDEMTEFLEVTLVREARQEDTSEVLLRIPLCLLDPFGCHYCLVDTPGHTESTGYEDMVMKFLQDHSHIACMVCPLTGGTPLPQSTRNILDRSYSRTMWVLTQYDDFLTRKTKTALSRREKVEERVAPYLRKSIGSIKRETAEATYAEFEKQIKTVQPDAKVFRHAGYVLTFDEIAQREYEDAMREFLPPEVAMSWLRALKAHVKDSFLAIQQEQLVLSSQSRQCMEIAAEIYQEYNTLKDGYHGKLAASDHYVREIQVAAEESAKLLEKEIRQVVDRIQGTELERFCQEAATEVKATGHFGIQQNYYEALVDKMLPRIQEALSSGVHEASRRAMDRVVEVAARFVSETSTSFTAAADGGSRRDVSAPSSDHLRARYPVENVGVLIAGAGTLGAAAVTESGPAILLSSIGRVGAGAAFGYVGVAAVSVITLGWAVKGLMHVNPAWTYASVETDVVANFRGKHNWGIMAEAYSGRAAAYLLYSAGHFRAAFSKALLIKGTPRQVLLEIFPDLSVFEDIHTMVEGVCQDIQDFVDSPDLSSRADQDLETCVVAERDAQWGDIIECTKPYIGANARTDGIPGDKLASLLRIRCHALAVKDVLGEARHTAGVFHSIFPQLLLPLVYRETAGVLFDFRAGVLDVDAARAAVGGLALRLAAARRAAAAEGSPREVPGHAEAWFYAAMASYLEGSAEVEQEEDTEDEEEGQADLPTFEFWGNDDVFQPYGAEDQRCLRAALVADPRPTEVTLPGGRYAIRDFQEVETAAAVQVNARTGFTRLVRIRPADEPLPVVARVVKEESCVAYLPKLLECASQELDEALCGPPCFEDISQKAGPTAWSRVTAVGGEFIPDRKVLDALRARLTHKNSWQTLPEQIQVEEGPDKDFYSELEAAFQEACAQYASRVVRRVHSFLAALPPQQLDMQRVGVVLARHLVEELHKKLALQRHLDVEQRHLDVEDTIMHGLCPVENTEAKLCEEWVRLLGEALMARARAVRPQAGAAGASGAAVPE